MTRDEMIAHICKEEPSGFGGSLHIEEIQWDVPQGTIRLMIPRGMWKDGTEWQISLGENRFNLTQEEANSYIDAETDRWRWD